jgi:glycerol-3-phosphate cytidylyltransferase
MYKFLKGMGNYMQNSENRTVYTGGTFDIPHFGHINFLKQCRRIAGEGKVVVSLNTDEFIEEYKGKKPIFSYDERARLLMKCGYVDKVVPNIGGSDSKPAILQVRPDFIVVGDDWAKKDYYAQMQFTQDWLDFHDIVLIYVPYFKHVSTSEIKRRLS